MLNNNAKHLALFILSCFFSISLAAQNSYLTERDQYKNRPHSSFSLIMGAQELSDQRQQVMARFIAHRNQAVMLKKMELYNRIKKRFSHTIPLLVSQQDLPNTAEYIHTVSQQTGVIPTPPVFFIEQNDNDPLVTQTGRDLITSEVFIGKTGQIQAALIIQSRAFEMLNTEEFRKLINNTIQVIKQKIAALTQEKLEKTNGKTGVLRFFSFWGGVDKHKLSEQIRNQFNEYFTEKTK